MGVAGSGKSTAGRILRDDYGFTPIAFADALKDGVAALYQWPRHLLEGDTLESRQFRETPDPYWSEVFNCSVTPRWVLQFIGTEVFRNRICDEFWIKAVGKKIQSDPSKNYVITDARFGNEFDFIRGCGGFLVEVLNTEKLAEWVEKVKELAAPAALKGSLYREVERRHVIEYCDSNKIHQSEWEHVWWRSHNPVDFMLYNSFTSAESPSTMENLAASITHMIRVFTGPKDEKTAKNKMLDTAF